MKKKDIGNQYYFGKTGAAKAGILTISGKKYCFNEKGKMLTTWQTVNGKTYYAYRMGYYSCRE